MRISDWSSDVCSSDLLTLQSRHAAIGPKALSVGAKAVLRSVWRSEYWPPSWMMHASTMKSSRRRAITAAATPCAVGEAGAGRLLVVGWGQRWHPSAEYLEARVDKLL